MSSLNDRLITQLDMLVILLRLLDENRFKIAALERASRVLEGLVIDVADMPVADLAAMPGIGKGVLSKIQSFCETGTIDELEDKMALVPAGLLDVMQLPGLGPSTTRTLWQQCGITDLDSLAQAIEQDQIKGIKGH